MKLLCSRITTLQKRVASQSKRGFTLIELLVCVSLITMLGGVFAFQGAQLWKRHQFQNEVDRFVKALQLSRHLSQSLRADIDIILLKDSEGLLLIRDMDEPQLLKMSHCFPARELFNRLDLKEDISIKFHGNGGYSSGEEIKIFDQTNPKNSVLIKNFLK